jgi:hypothetical protein
MIINLDDYEEIKQSEYKRLKRDDAKNVNGYTMRVLFKYYKKKQENKIFTNELSDLSIEFIKDWAVIIQEDGEDSRNVSLGKYPNARWEIIEKALEYAKRGENMK